MKSGIYKITNIVNNKIYIGSAVNIANRISAHKCCLQKNNHHSKHLQRSWNKYGENSFKFEPILYCLKDELINVEQYLIDFYKPEYNVSPTAGNCLGVKHTEKTRENMSRAHIGIRQQPESIEKIKSTLAGRPNTWQTKNVFQFDLSNQFIKSFISTAEAGREMNIRDSSIARAARNNKSLHGFIWKYENVQN